MVEQNDADEGAGREGTSLGDYGETIVPHFVELLEGQGLQLSSPGWPLLTNHKPGPGNITVLVPQDRSPDSEDETTGH